MNRKSTQAPESLAPTNDDGMTAILPSLHRGDPEAARLVFNRYAERLARLAKKYLNLALARRVDAEDITQSVFRTFFRRVGAGEFRIETAQELWCLLTKITIMKVRARRRRHWAAKRDTRVEVKRFENDDRLFALATEPTAIDAIILADTVQAALLGLPHFYSAILELRLRGFAVAEIAILLQKSPRSINRALTRLKLRLAEAGISRL